MPHADKKDALAYQAKWKAEKRESDPDFKDRERAMKADWYRRNREKKNERQRIYRQQVREQKLMEARLKVQEEIFEEQKRRIG